MDNIIHGKIVDEDVLRRYAEEWAKLVQAKAKANIAQMRDGKKRATVVYKSGRYKGKREKRLRTISYVMRSKESVLDSISWRFPLHGIFVHYGVGSGQSAKKGKQRAKNIYVKRTPNEFLNEPIEKELENLTNMVAEYYGDKVLYNVYGIR